MTKTDTSKENSTLFHAQSIDKSVEMLKTNLSSGLSENEAQQRLSTYGPNQLKAHNRKSIFKMFLAQLQDALIYVLFAAVVITMFMGEYLDGIIIIIVILINATLGVVQEIRAGNAIEALRKMATPKALVKRDNQVKEIGSEDVVPGDIVILDAGRYIPADLRLVESANLQIDESALTGESVAAEKDASAVFSEDYIPLGDRVNLAYMSTLVTYGRGIGVVTGTGTNTEVGKIADILSQDSETKTPLEVRLDQLGKTLGKAALAICVLIFIISFFQGRDLTEMFLTSVSLAVAAIPEGLAAIVAVVLSIGVTKMAKQNAIIKRLPAVETLGSVNIVCSDKTGTLTQNKMTVQEFFTFTDKTQKVEDQSDLSAEAHLLSSAMVLASDATLENGDSTGDPTEIALLQLADDLKIDRAALSSSQPRIDEKAFDSNRKMMSTLHQQEDKFVIYAKGAIDSIILKCKHIVEDGEIIPLTETHKTILSDAADAMSDKALRTLAVAYKPLEKQIDTENFERNLVMIGVVGMIDPPREEVKDAIATAKEAGISTIMITGDHKNTALAIAKELGIASKRSEATTGAAINNMSREELESHIEEYKVFARVSPEHKVNIVKAFRAKGNIVSMTGDGVNDAPSLNAADIGVAMGIEGTDVAKNASDMILADDNFSTIIAAIEQGRNIYNNIKKSVIFLLACNVGEVITMLVAIGVGLPIPLIATQLLWINLLTDTLPAVALGMDPGDKDVMKEKPRPLNDNFFSHGAGRRVILAGILMGILTIVAFVSGYYLHGYSPFADNIPENIEEYARTLAFLTIIGCQLFYSFSFRHEYKSIFRIGFFSNKYLFGSVVVGLLLQLIVLYVPFMTEAFKLQAVGIKEWLGVFVLSIIPLLANEVVKVFTRRKIQ
ncbi:cation-translocating P-type ATPase [Sphingobacterium chuzhouense]|uniref:Cation-translocating P-type ATPase n=1 Tax=Sphingobacterium chuzhouense TaxID=1742264 RepID=A0ABR7XU44_9SPHI|nr:cation-translocating P-type ATPase [Sphingobacterium chuzhouense]MBD1422524.1 cation-translocating P-type ATPase [Sphingobacterium chuzhouense]